MNYCWIVFISFMLSILSKTQAWSDNKQRRFPEGFMFGAATSAYQVEGAWDIDGKGESIWDRYFHENPEVVADGRNGDVAADSYHLYRRDVEMLRELNVDHYRFSISWARILPTGLPDSLNEKGVKYYNDLINELIKYNITPMVTLYHFDLPQKLQDEGGWKDPRVVQWFEDYARVVFEHFGDRVKYWITVNQPDSVCMEGYGGTVLAPALGERGTSDYICVKNILLAHAKAYRLYDKDYKKKYGGSVGISLGVLWADPTDKKEENVQARDLFLDFMVGMYMDPIWSKLGDFPSSVKQLVASNSRKQGYSQSRLPALTREQVNLIKGSADFLGMNHYTTVLVSADSSRDAAPHTRDLHVRITRRDQWKKSQSPWLRSAPYGIYKALIYINQKYDYPRVWITEHGWSCAGGVSDPARAHNMREYLKAVLFALEDGTDLRGYTVWSLLDNVEWSAGTSERFGLYEVDFESENKTRTPRLSAHVYKRIIDKRYIEPDWKPDSMTMCITKKKSKKDEL